MKQIVAYDHKQNVILSEAVALAKENFPSIDFSTVKSKLDLETLLAASGEVLFVEVDVDDNYISILESEKTVAAEVAEELASDCSHEEDVVFSEADVADVDVCDVDEESMLFDAAEDSELESVLEDISRDNDVAVSAVLSCVGDIKAIAEKIDSINKRGEKLRKLAVSLEELLYQYRIMDSFFEERRRVVHEVVDTFDPLVEAKRKKESELRTIRANKSARERELAKLESMSNRNTDLETIVKSQISVLESRASAKQNEVDYASSKIAKERNKNPILNDTFNDYNRTTLSERIAGIIGGNSPVSIKSFTSKTEAKQNSASAVGIAFDIVITFDLSDEAGFLDGRPKSYMRSSDGVVVVPVPDPSAKPTGFLYERLYNVWGDVDVFFTREERGLSADPLLASVELADAARVGSNFVSDVGSYKNFYENFAQKWQDKVDFVKENVIEPEIIRLSEGVRSQARNEVLYYLSFGKVFDHTSKDGGDFGTILQTVVGTSNSYLGKVDELREDLRLTIDEYNSTLVELEVEKSKLQAVKCVSGKEARESAHSVPPGSDPMGVESLKKSDPSNPNLTKYCYWTQFAKLATAVGILPLPGVGGFRYWPIGMLVPSPNGIVRIPLPIVWIPLAVIPLPVGIFVVFIAQCGICPSPVVFYMGPNGEKKFIVSLRPGTDFGSDASSGLIKLLSDAGLAVSAKISDLLKKISVPGVDLSSLDSESSSILQEMKDKVLKKVSKLGLPDASPLAVLSTKDSVSKKKDALKEAVLKHIDKVEFPSLNIPKNQTTVNPKLPNVKSVLDEMKKSLKLSLPEMELPPTIDLKEILIGPILDAEFSVDDLDPFDELDDEKKKKHFDSARAYLKKVAEKAKNEITPERLGVLAQAEYGITFFNAYKCRPAPAGYTIPALPVAVVAGLAALLLGLGSVIDNINFGGKKVDAAFLKSTLVSALNALPSVHVPNPSKSSIKSMFKDTVTKLAKLQAPSLPDLSVPIQLNVSIPGSMLKSSLKEGVEKTIDAMPVSDIDFSNLSAVDLSQIVYRIVELSFAPIEAAAGPFLKIINVYKAAKDKGFAETLGLKKINKDDSSIPVVTEEALKRAFVALSALALVPYPVVALAPEAFKHTHPILTADDIPPWERLTLSNILFVCFLDEWNKQGKKTSGFFENP